MKIAFFDAKPYDRESFEEANTDDSIKIKYFPSHLNIDTVELARGFDGVCIFVNDFITQEVADRLYDLGIQFIALRSAGYNNIDLKAVFGRIHVLRVPAYSPHAVAEHTVALMLSLNRKIHKAYYRTKESNFSINGFLGFDMHGKTAGIIGTGKIGMIVSEILRGFGMDVITYDPYPKEEWGENNGIKYVSKDELYKRSDIISLHCPLTPENVHLINSETISKMKHGVYIFNTGRGKLINTQELIDGLKTKKIGGAGLDVYEEETDYFFEDFSSSIVSDDVLARLLTFPNVLITSHQAFFTKEALRNIADTTLENIKAMRDGKRLDNEICYQCGADKKSCRKTTVGRCF